MPCKLLVVALVTVANWELAKTEMNQTVARKVTPVLPSGASDCLLDEVDLSTASSLACAALCARSPHCLLYCLKGRVCSLFSAHVSGRWTGVNTTSDLTYDKCYSTWYLANDLTLLINNTSSCSIKQDERLAKFAVNGFYCVRCDGFCFTSDNKSEPWWRADLGDSMTVSSIRIVTRKCGADEIDSRFNNVTVTLGNYSEFNNLTFGTYIGMAPKNHIALFRSTAPITGRYLHVRSTATGMLMICDIQVLG